MATVTFPETTRVAAPPLHQDEALYEVIDGQRVEVPPMSILAVLIASRLAQILGSYATAHDLGMVLVEALFHLPLRKERDRRPDVAFVSYGRWPKSRPLPTEGDAWDVVPNLGVEVVSPTDRAEDLLERVEEYFQAGMEVVWVVYPRRRIVHAYDSLTQIQVVTRADELDGGEVLPGFRLPLALLFQEPAPAP
jgi:Uma2 family endonuclease